MLHIPAVVLSANRSNHNYDQASSKEKSIFLVLFIFRVLPDPHFSDANTF